MVELLTRAAPDTLTLAQIVRATGMSRATAHALVAELVEQGWATRRATTGAIGLGPGFTALARTAARADLVGQWSAAPIERLVAEHEMPCFLARRLTDDTITVGADTDADAPEQDESTESAGGTSWFTPGRRIRLRPPICREFVAWESPTYRADWIARAPASTRTRLGLALDAVAARGFSIERMTNDHVALISALDTLDAGSPALRTRLEDLLTELTAIDYLADELHGPLGVVTIGAPVRDGTGRVVASIVCCPNRTLEAEQLLTLGNAVRAAADEVSDGLRG